MEDTAAMVPEGTDLEDTGAPLGDDLPPEIALDDLMPETDVEPETPETEPEDPLIGKTDDDLKKDPRVAAVLEKELKAQEAKLQESARRRIENAEKAVRAEKQEENHRQEVQRLRGDTGRAFISGISRDVASSLAPLVKKWAEESMGEGNFTPDPRVIHEAVRSNLVAAVDSVIANGIEENAGLWKAYRKSRFADYRPEEEDLSALDDARRAKDFKKVGAIEAAMLLKAQLATVEPGIRSDERKKVLKEIRENAEAKKANASAQARQEKPKPTTAQANGASTAGPRITIEEIDRIGVNGFRSRFPDPAVRAKVLAEAREHSGRQLAGSR